MGLSIDQTTAKRLFNESPQWFKEQLTEVFGEECFKKRHYKDIKTFEDACDELGIAPFSVFEAGKDSPDEIAYKKLKVITKAINQGWTPDWNNTDQQKWYPWFRLSSGFGFDVSLYAFGYANTTVGSRLCFESKEKSTYAGTQFIDIYEQLITIKD
jgi:hypothetical protein